MAKANWRCPSDWSEWTEWLASGLHGRNRWRLPVLLVELWAWNRTHAQLCNRRDSPWDDPERRPSHADRRKALRRYIMQTELSSITATWSLPRKILNLTRRLMASAA